MADNVEKLSLDASGYLKEVDKIIKIMDRANAQAEKFNVLMGHLETEIDNNTASITRRNLAGDILTTRLKQEDGAWKIVAQSVRDHTVVTQKQAYAIKELDDAMRKVRESRAADAAHGITGREGEIALQIALDKEIEYQKRSEREFDRHVEAVLKKQRELYRKLVEEATKANQKSSNERNSGLVTNQLSKQFITPSIATPAEVQKLEANIGRISSLVAQGTVSATRALQIVNSVSKNTGEIFTGTELRVANATRSMIKSSQDLGSNYRKEVTSMAAANEQSVTRILLGWREMARLITVRALTNLFHAFINELRTTIVTATEFARHIGEIQTISQDAPLTFDRWTASVRALSDQFGRPIADVAEGTYQTLSNQVAKGTDAILFMTDALKFSQVTLSTTAQSVNLLSGALNAFHLSADQTDRVASVLFKTIQLGRVRAEEMSETFGRVGVLASRLGVTIEETAAATSTLTIQGVKFADASTQLTNILIKLLHPTEEMQKLFKEWGVSSGPAAISTFGFIGVVKKLEEAAKGSSKELADLFNEIKGTRGILGLTGSAFKTYDENLKKITASSNSYAEAQKTIRENVGQKFTEELTRIKNLFNEFGLDAIRALTTLSTTTGHFADGIKNLTEVATVGIKTFVIYKTGLFLIKTELAQTAIQAWNLSAGLGAASRAGIVFGSARNLATGVGAGLVGTLTSPIALIAAGVAYHQYLKNQQEELGRFYDEESARQLQVANEVSDKQIKLITAQSTFIQQEYSKRTQYYFDHLAEINKLDTQLSAIESKLITEASKNVKEALEYDLKALEHQISETHRVAETALQNIKKLQEGIFESQEELTKTLYDRHLKLLEPTQQIKTELAHINQLEKDSLGLLNAKDNKDPLTAKENIAKADKLSKEALRELSGLEEKRATLLEKQKNDQTKLLELKQREAALTEHTNLSEDIRGLTNQQRQSRVKKRNDLGLGQQIGGLRDQAGEESSAEQLRKLQQERAELEKNLDLANSQLKLLPTTQQFEEQILKISKEQEISKQHLIDLQQKQSELAKTEAENLERQAAILRQSITDIAEFGSKKHDAISDDKTKEKRLGAFDELVGNAVKGGLTDQSTFFQIQQLRVKISEDADRQILESKKKSSEQELELAKRTQDGSIAKLTEGLSAATKQRVQAVGQVKTAFETLNKFAITEAGPRGKFDGFTGIETPALQKILADFSKNPATSAKTVQNAFGTILQDIVSQQIHLGAKSPENVKIGEGASAISVSEFQNQFTKAITDAVLSSKLQNNLEPQLKTLQGKQLIPAFSDLDVATSNFQKYNDNYIKQIDQVTGQLQSLDTTLSQIQARFQALLQGNVSPQTPVKATPSSGPGPQSSAVGGNFPITINYYGTGNIPIDVLAIGKGLQQALRLGTLSPFT